MDIKTIIEFVRSRPVWARVVAVVVVALIAAVTFFSSCSTVRTTLNSSGEVHTSVHQSVLDSTSVTVRLFSK